MQAKRRAKNPPPPVEDWAVDLQEKACVGLSPFEHLPLRDSFGSRTEYDASDPAISVNGRIHDLYVEHFEGAMRVMEQNHQVLQRLVHEHRGQWSLRRFKDWLV